MAHRPTGNLTDTCQPRMPPEIIVPGLNRPWEAERSMGILTDGMALLSTCAEAAFVVTDLRATADSTGTGARGAARMGTARVSLTARENIADALCDQICLLERKREGTDGEEVKGREGGEISRPGGKNRESCSGRHFSRRDGWIGSEEKTLPIGQEPVLITDNQFLALGNRNKLLLNCASARSGLAPYTVTCRLVGPLVESIGSRPAGHSSGVWIESTYCVCIRQTGGL